MATYIVLNVMVLLAIWVLLAQWLHKPSRAWVFTLSVIVTLTLVFDNLLIWMDMFSYASDKILGYYILFAPVEDFFYALVAVILIPALWYKFGGSRA